jgi:endoglucanase
MRRSSSVVFVSLLAVGCSGLAASSNPPPKHGTVTPVGNGSDAGVGSGTDGSALSDGGGPVAAPDASDGGAPIVTPGAPGYLHTQGGAIVDDKGTVVRLTGLSWFGFETSNFAPHGLWARPLGSMLDQVQSLGYNVIRVPYTNQMLRAGSTPNGIDFTQNPDLQGLTPLALLDKLIDGAKARHLRIILDRHRPDANGQSELWYTASVSEQQWLSDWTMLAQRYAGNPTVIGADLHNEPHGAASWGDGNMATDWRLAAERGGNAVLAANPDLLIIVEGVDHVGNDYYWWGGNLAAAAGAPVRLAVANRLVYSPHDYPASVSGQPWFNDPAYPANLPSVWDAHWGALAKSGTAPVWVGEFGSLLQTKSDQQWMTALTSYIGQRGLSFSFWCLNPDSGDTGGLLLDDWKTVNLAKQTLLQPILAPLL